MSPPRPSNAVIPRCRRARTCVFLTVMRTLVRGLAVGRIAFGAAMLIRPEAAVRGWIGKRPASYGGTQTITQAFGARDLSLGVGTLAALMTGKDGRDWVLLAAFADAVDLAATVTQDDLPLSGRVIVAIMASSAIAVSAGYALNG